MTRIHGKATLARIFVGEDDEDDRCRGSPLFDAMLCQAREMKLGGCTVPRAVEGFGASTMVHSSRILGSSEDLPIVVEIADTREHFEPFLDRVASMLAEAGCGRMKLRICARIHQTAYVKARISAPVQVVRDRAS